MNWPLKIEFSWCPVVIPYFLLASETAHVCTSFGWGRGIFLHSNLRRQLISLERNQKSCLWHTHTQIHTQRNLIPFTLLLWQLHCNASLIPSPTPPLKASPVARALLMQFQLLLKVSVPCTHLGGHEILWSCQSTCSWILMEKRKTTHKAMLVKPLWISFSLSHIQHHHFWEQINSC